MRTALVAVTVLATACTSSTSGTPPSPSSSAARAHTEVTCTISGAAAADHAAIERAFADRATATVSARATAQLSGDTLVIDIDGRPHVDGRALCQVGILEVRGLVAPTVPVTCPGAERCTTDWTDLDLPATEPDWDGLSTKARTRFQAALTTYGCTTVAAAPTTRPRIACDDMNTPNAYLLGPAVFASSAIAGATPQPPSSNGPQWTVLLHLTGAGASAWHDYTSAHNSGGQSPVTGPNSCGADVPCADYVAFVLDGVVLSAPITLAPLADDTQISGGDLNHAAAAQLADNLALGALVQTSRYVSTRSFP